MNLPKNYISYNQIRQYQVCPQKYYYSYIKKIQTPINENVFLGTVFHSVVEHYLKEKIAGTEWDKDEVIDRFDACFSQLKHDNDIVWKKSEEANRDRGISFAKYFVTELAATIQPLMVEKELETDMPEIGIKLRGILDLVETDFSITDFKTTTSRWSKERIKSSRLQMEIYKYLFEHNFGDVTSNLKLLIVYSKNARKVDHQIHCQKSGDIEKNKMVDIIRYVADNISQGVFYKNISYFCSFCDFSNLCRKNGS